MVCAPVPPDEARRLARLHDLLVLDSPAEPVFDSIARIASEVCGVPVALLSLVDAHRQWFKAKVGLPGISETPRDVAFCAHAIASDTLFEVEDALHDPRFVDNPMVADTPDIRFYAGAPLVTSDGARIGTLCVIDRKPHRLSAEQARQLTSLAEIAVQALEMRSQLAERALSVRSAHEVALADSEARHRAILDAQSELISQALPDGTLIYVNPAYAQQFGRSVDAILGTSLYDYVHPADCELVREQITQVIDSGERIIGENRMAAGGFDEQWFAWTNTRQIDSGGHSLLHSVGRDISAHKRAEKALRDSESLLQRTGQVAGVGGWQFDLRSAALTWSAQTRAIHEVDADYTPTLDGAIDFYAPEARPVIEAAVRTAIEQGEPWDLELPFITAKGRHIWVRTQGECEFDAGGAPLRLVGAFQDITERRQLEQRLLDNERFLRLVTDGMPQRMAYIDRDLRYRFVNGARARWFGLDRDRIIGRSRAEITGVPTPPQIQLHFERVLAGEPQHFEYDEETAEGTRRLDCQFLPDFDDDGKVRGFFTTASDITERSRGEQRLRELTAILENSPDFVVQTDWRGNITYMNPAVRAAVGLASDAPLDGLNFAQFNTDATNRHFVEVIVPEVKASGAWVGETTVVVSGGRELPVSQLVVAHRDDRGRVARYSAVMRDISAAARARHELQMQTATLGAVTEAVPATVAVIGSDLRYRFVNSAFERWIGLRRDEVIGRTVAQVLGAEDLQRSGPWLDRVLAGESVQFERTSPKRGIGRNLAMSYTPLTAESGAVDGFISVGQDITAHRQEQYRLLQLSERDALTGLFNRAGFDRRVAREVEQGHGDAIALLYVDLDHFKPVNDRHGHPVGDRLLQLVAQRLLSLVRPTDVVARLGGDEFALLLTGVREAANAEAVADKVIGAAASPFVVGDLTLQIGASVGVAFGVDPAAGAGDLVARADAMLYRAKRAGRGIRVGESA